MELSNVTNNPVSFKLSGRDFLIKRLSLLDLFAEFEVGVKKQYMDDIALMAERIKDQKERVEFQRSALKDMPKGKELEELGKDAMNTFEGGVKLLYKALSKCNQVTEEEVKSIASNPSNNTGITNIMNYITGVDVDLNKDEAEELPKDAKVIKVEKKTS